MANYGNHDQHVKAGQQSHKNSDNGSSNKQQQMSATAWGQNDSSQDKYQRSSGTQGGTHEQHVKAGQQSHKNSY